MDMRDVVVGTIPLGMQEESMRCVVPHDVVSVVSLVHLVHEILQRVMEV